MAAAAEEQWVQRGQTVPIPEATQAIGFQLLTRLRSYQEKTLMVDGVSGQTVNGAQLLARSIAVAEELRTRGVGPGDIVCAALDNCLEVAYVQMGILFSGAIYAPFNPHLHADDIRHILRLVSPKMVLSEACAVEVARATLPDAQVVERRAGDPEWDALVGVSAPVPAPSAVAAFQVRGPDDVHSPLCILFSSGTTGSPKGVMLSHSNWHHFLQSADIIVKTVAPQAFGNEVVLLMSTNTWLSGFLSMMISLSQGSKLVVYPSFDVDELLKGIEQYRLTSMLLSPPMIAAIAKHPGVEGCDTASVMTVRFSGSALSPALQDLAAKKLRKRVDRFYGLTESLLLVLPGPLSQQKPNTVGKVAFNAAMKVVDVETGKIVGPNVEGEICFKSPMTFTGYYKNPEATANAIDKNGWVHTGDAGYFDEDGYFFIVDRYKELIKYKGTIMAPADVENILTAHEGVRDAAVVGIEHDEDQEHPVGFVVRQEGHGVTAQELHKMLKDQLPEYKQLHGGIHFIEEIPRNVTGKIKRRELRQQARTLRDQKS